MSNNFQVDLTRTLSTPVLILVYFTFSTGTGRVLILHEDKLIGGIGGEIAAWITENCFGLPDAPVMRCASLDTPNPFNIELENNFMAKAKLDEIIQKLMRY